MAEENNIKENIARNLVYYRKSYGLTQMELAEKLSYTDKSVSKWERGESVPDIFVLKALADLYGIKVDDFYRDKPRRLHNRQVRRRLVAALLSIAAIWVVATVIYTVIMVLYDGRDIAENVWLVFLWAIVASAITGVMFTFFYKKRFIYLISLTIFIWSAAVAIFCTVNQYSEHTKFLWLVFIVAVPLQVLATLQYLLRWSFVNFTDDIMQNFRRRVRKKNPENDSTNPPQDNSNTNSGNSP
ncbi:MAG: helix-turn-helix domain-containing protein [Coprobacillus sp.]|nr:helix-turn-helix domain-containing protein [Coprobacillus sp.]